MKKYVAAAALASSLFVALPAFAQTTLPAYPPQPYYGQDTAPDAAPEAEPEVPAEKSLSGLRVELAGGFDRLELSYIEDDTKYYAGANGVRYGGEIGYDLPVSSSTLLGAYAGVTGTSVNRCDEIFGEDSLCQKPGIEISGGVRVGFRFGQASQLYLRGGYSNLKLELAYEDGGFSDFTQRRNYNGLHLGMGVEHTLNGGVYLKGDVSVAAYDTSDSLYEDLTFQRTQATVGLGFRF